MDESRNVCQPYFFNKPALLAILDHNNSGRCVQSQNTGCFGRDEPVLDGHCYGTNGSVAAHRQAAGCFDEQDGSVTIFTC